MSGLEELYLQSNKLEEIPEGAFVVLSQNLRVLDISYNMMKTLPPDLLSFERLEVFDCSWNDLTKEEVERALEVEKAALARRQALVRAAEEEVITVAETAADRLLPNEERLARALVNELDTISKEEKITAGGLSLSDGEKETETSTVEAVALKQTVTTVELPPLPPPPEEEVLIGGYRPPDEAAEAKGPVLPLSVPLPPETTAVVKTEEEALAAEESEGSEEEGAALRQAELAGAEVLAAFQEATTAHSNLLASIRNPEQVASDLAEARRRSDAREQRIVTAEAPASGAPEALAKHMKAWMEENRNFLSLGGDSDSEGSKESKESGESKDGVGNKF